MDADPLAAITDEMVVAAVNGDEQQRHQLFDQLTVQVRIMVNVRLNPALAQSHLAEDLVQETLLALSARDARGLASLERRTAAGLRAFASTIVSRRVADALRAKNRVAAGALPNRQRSLDSAFDPGRSTCGGGGPMWAMLSAGGASPLTEADRQDRFDQVMAGLSQLNEAHRTVITLAFFDQLETRDIAERMSLTRPAVSMLVIRAVKALRRHLTGSSRILHLRETDPAERASDECA